jgi:hypothetical protein
MQSQFSTGICHVVRRISLSARYQLEPKFLKRASDLYLIGVFRAVSEFFGLGRTQSITDEYSYLSPYLSADDLRGL